MAFPADIPLSPLIAQAEALALRRQEELSGVHLFAALGAIPGRVCDLLNKAGADFRKILDASERLQLRGPQESREKLLSRVRTVARQFGVKSASAPHLLLALLEESGHPIEQILAHLKVDILALREGTIRLAQGQPARRPLAAGNARAVVVPVTPTPERASVPRNVRVAHSLAAQALPVIPQVGPKPLPGRKQMQAAPRQELHFSAPTGLQALTAETDAEPIEDISSLLGAALRDVGHERHVDEVAFANSQGRSAVIGKSQNNSSSEIDLSAYSLAKKRFPILTQVGRNLTLLAAQGRLDEVVCRDDEIEEALDVLAKRQANNPCLIGGAGVGKSSVARGIAARLFEDSLQEKDENRLVIEIPISELMAGTGVRGALAARMNALKKEVKLAEGRVVLFFDEIHQLFSGEGAEEISSDLKLTLSRGELPCIGATQIDEYRKIFETDTSLARRFSPVEIEEPNREDAYVVLSAVAKKLEHHHGVSIDDDALRSVIDWSLRYLPGRCLPDKAVSIVDLAGARARRRGFDNVNKARVAEVVSASASLPVERLLESDGERMMQLAENLQSRVIGHEQHLERIARILRRNAAGIGTRRPIGTFLLLGPTGVGKTETAKAIAEVLFHDQSALTRIDMAEMSEAHAVAKLVGAPPGYVGHDAGGQLTEAIRRRPYQVLLLDEIEKAHPEVLTAFLAVFDEGRMTDSRGRLVDFTNTVIILTSNLGADVLRRNSRRRVGFSDASDDVYDPELDKMLSSAKASLPPELYNRIDEVLAFSPLTRDDVVRIGQKLIAELSDELELSRGIRLAVSIEALSLLLELGGYDPEFGARPLRRTLSRYVEAPLAEAILAGNCSSGQTWQVAVEDGELHSRALHMSHDEYAAQ